MKKMFKNMSLSDIISKFQEVASLYKKDDSTLADDQAFQAIVEKGLAYKNEYTFGERVFVKHANQFAYITGIHMEGFSDDSDVVEFGYSVTDNIEYNKDGQVINYGDKHEYFSGSYLVPDTEVVNTVKSKYLKKIKDIELEMQRELSELTGEKVIYKIKIE
jgi:hypothetical protein